MNASRNQNINAVLVSLAVALLAFSSLFTFITLRARLVQKTTAASLASQPRKIVYLTSPTEALGEVDRAAFVAEGATLIGTDVNLKELDAALPFEALIFDSSARTRLDAAWLRQRYAWGLVVIGINMTVIELADLVGDKAVVREPELWKDSDAPPTGPYYSLLYSLVTGANPAEVELYLTQLLTYTAAAGSVDSVWGINSQLRVSRGNAHQFLNPPNIKTLFFNLRNEIDSLRAAKEAIQSQPTH